MAFSKSYNELNKQVHGMKLGSIVKFINLVVKKDRQDKSEAEIISTMNNTYEPHPFLNRSEIFASKKCSFG